ncbi:hypothetical protein [Fuscibacter oryzae]|uniref:Uncharacterized protein n=1 Tax=Fuscibacter oryzae TaxID=2803939 RepID=A0A8J7SVW9_9RHOB|nr:hypothetical protein [Fuscibacter oryzae]MBL4928254.1 hypothetical protein [Fuscibacter oryzae]
MTFRKQTLIGLCGGALCLVAAYAVLFVNEVVLENAPADIGALAWPATAISVAGIFALIVSIWRVVARLLLLKTGAIEHTYIGDFLCEIPFWQWVLHCDSRGRDRDA